MKRKKIIRYTLLFLLVFGAAAAFYIYKEYNRKLKDTAKLKPDFTLTVKNLLDEFAANEKEAGEKYMDKVLRVEGNIKDLIRDEKGFYTVVLGDSLSMSSVRCSMDSTHSAEAEKLQKGTPVAMKGVCTGYTADELLGSDVVLVRSVVDNKK